MTETKWKQAKCPVCGEDYSYAKDGYNPKTCNKFECVHKFLHPTIYNSKNLQGIKEVIQ